MIKVRASLHRCSKLKGGPKPFRKSNWKKQIRYFRCKRDYRQDGTWVEAEKWGVGITRRRATFGVAGLGERRRLAGTSSMCQPLQHMLTRTPSDAKSAKRPFLLFRLVV